MLHRLKRPDSKERSAAEGDRKRHLMLSNIFRIIFFWERVNWFYLIRAFLNAGHIIAARVEREASADRQAREKNQNLSKTFVIFEFNIWGKRNTLCTYHCIRNILSFMMFRLRTHIAWSTLRFPVTAPDGNWQLKFEFEFEFEASFYFLGKLTYEVTVGNSEHIGLAFRPL